MKNGVQNDTSIVAADVDGRDIALRCPRPRSSGRNEFARRVFLAIRCAAAERGADGAARRPYLKQAVAP